ncbi:hypothetical protein G7Y89_g8287 [Cudoniella acicularis]|uniref:Aspartokinase n=1 Tax=Cudoniella acicularis TaxID=354080 RepID=A0A8H4RJE4_9HELO|nr:hypothetical protein G7Y89_g8287 [Cudoniella acicularis]
MTFVEKKAGSRDDESWIVQKFGGTSIGKYPLNVVENVIIPATCHNRVVIVCSARSSSTKSEGTTNTLLQAYRHCLKPDFDHSKTLVQRIRTEHINAAHGYIKSPDPATKLAQEIEDECLQTLRLLQATRTIGHGTSHIRDMIISTGERLACYFLCALLRDRDVVSEVVDFSDIVPSNISTTVNQSFYDKVSTVMAKRINCRQLDGKVPVVTGFFGPIHGGLLTGIGRGYTDFCASLVSVGLHAQELQVWKEVEGIFTADPGKVPSATMIPIISSEEASELTFHGSEVVHHTAMRLVMHARIRIRIKNVLNTQAAGTLVQDDWELSTPSSSLSSSPSLNAVPCLDAPRALAITSKDKILLINIRSAERLRPHSFFAGIFSVLDYWNLSVDLLCTSGVQVSMALHPKVSLITGEDEDDSELIRGDLKSAISQLQEHGNVDLFPKRTIVSVVGKQFKRSLGVTGQIFSTLSENGINVEMIAQGASETSISCVIQEQYADRAVALLHAALVTSLPPKPSVALLEALSEV